MAKTYEEYEKEQLEKARKDQAAYEAARRTQADQAAATVTQTYDEAKTAATKQYMRAAQEEAQAYRELYDANAVDELVARRDVEEAIANSGLLNSGLNRTQQTAVSLQRSRADSLTREQQQQAVTTIMQKLDALRGQYDREAASRTADIYASAQSDIGMNLYTLTAAARQNATSLYNAEQARLTAEYAAEQERLASQAQAPQPELSPSMQAYKIASMNHNIPSYTAVKTQADLYARQDQQLAIQYLNRQIAAGYITAEQYEALVKEYSGADLATFYLVSTEMKQSLPSEMEFYKYRKGAGTYKQYIAQRIEETANTYGFSENQTWMLAQEFGITLKDLDYRGTIQMYRR